MKTYYIVVVVVILILSFIPKAPVQIVKADACAEVIRWANWATNTYTIDPLKTLLAPIIIQNIDIGCNGSVVCQHVESFLATTSSPDPLMTQFLNDHYKQCTQTAQGEVIGHDDQQQTCEDWGNGVTDCGSGCNEFRQSCPTPGCEPSIQTCPGSVVVDTNPCAHGPCIDNPGPKSLSGQEIKHRIERFNEDIDKSTENPFYGGSLYWCYQLGADPEECSRDADLTTPWWNIIDKGKELLPDK